MIFQDPLSSLHPFYKVGKQLIGGDPGAPRRLRRRRRASGSIELLGMVGIPDPSQRVDSYPHEFSGGMRQRAMIAMALANEPKLLIADEPTTALDVTVQAQILDLIARLQRELDMAVVLITHDLGVVAEVTDEIAVMYAGKVDRARADRRRSSSAPEHPYTWGLLQSIPRLDRPRGEPLIPIAGLPPSLITLPSGCSFHPRCPYVRERHRRVEPAARAAAGRSHAPVACLLAERHPQADLAASCRPGVDPQQARAAVKLEEDRMSEALVEVRDLVKHFPLTRGIIFQRQIGAVHAVDGVSFDVLRGETLGIVGETGCGKTTTARLIMRLLEPTSGTIRFDGRGHHASAPARVEAAAARDADRSSRTPTPRSTRARRSARSSREPFAIHGLGAEDGAQRRRAVQELMEQVGLNPEHYNRYPHEFSGGQRQRIGVARALALKPKLIIADEPVSALDVSIQAQILNLLRELQRDLGLTLILIAHDLSVVRHMCDRIAVMYLGKIVELAPNDALYEHPRHPYTGALLSAVPVPDPELAGKRRREVPPGDVPSPTNPPRACRFHPRCPKAQEVCAQVEPPLEPKGDGHARGLPLPAHAGGGRRARSRPPRRDDVALARPDDQHAAPSVMRDLAGHASEQKAPTAVHALAAHHDQVGALLLGDLEDRLGGVSLARVALGLDAHRARRVGNLLEHGVDVHGWAHVPGGPLGVGVGTRNVHP